MTTGIANGIANGWLDGMSGWFVGLHTADPGAAGATSQCTGSVGGSRKASTMNAAAAGSKAQSAGGSWVAWDGGSVTISHISCFTLVTAGVFQFSGALTAGKAITNGDTFNLTSLSVALTPIAA
jgi:hypothetical protein